MQSPIMKYFKYEHLPEQLQIVSAPICELALTMEKNLPDGPEKSAGLRKLLEAKDCFVRAEVPISYGSGGAPAPPPNDTHTKGM